MSFNGAKRKHGKTIGYIIECLPHQGALVACYGYHDPKKTVMLGGGEATFFETRHQAKRAMKDSLAEDADRRLRIVRVAKLA